MWMPSVPVKPGPAGFPDGSRYSRTSKPKQLSLLDGPALADPGHWVRQCAALWVAEGGPERRGLYVEIGAHCHRLLQDYGAPALLAALQQYLSLAPLTDAAGRLSRSWPDYSRIHPADFAKRFERYHAVATLAARDGVDAALVAVGGAP